MLQPDVQWSPFRAPTFFYFLFSPHEAAWVFMKLPFWAVVCNLHLPKQSAAPFVNLYLLPRRVVNSKQQYILPVSWWIIPTLSSRLCFCFRTPTCGWVLTNYTACLTQHVLLWGGNEWWKCSCGKQTPFCIKCRQQHFCLYVHLEVLYI